jgi:citrate lyase subunit beta/citryl-CoA lyase
LAAQPTEVGAKMQVRVNALETPWAVDDLAAVPVGVAIRLTKTGAPADVSAALERAGGSHPVHALLETAAGIEGAAEIARHPNVCSLALGEADLRAELGATDKQAMNWLRVRVAVPSGCTAAQPSIPGSCP